MDFLTEKVQDFVKQAKNQCLEHRAKRAKTGLFRSGFLVDKTPELSNEMLDFIDKVTTNDEYTRNLIKEVIDLYTNNPVLGARKRLYNSTESKS